MFGSFWSSNHFLLCSIGSPLVMMLRTLIEMDDEHGHNTSSVPILMGIFRAIQMAGDLAEAEDLAECGITHVYFFPLFWYFTFAYQDFHPALMPKLLSQKLHILSRIGLLIVKELDKHCKISDSPRHFPLPSSYFRVSGSARKTDVSYSASLFLYFIWNWCLVISALAIPPFSYVGMLSRRSH